MKISFQMSLTIISFYNDYFIGRGIKPDKTQASAVKKNLTRSAIKKRGEREKLRATVV